MISNIALFTLYVVVSTFGLYKLKSADGPLSADFAIGFASYGFGFLVWYYVLTRLPLSFAFPIAAGSLIVATQIVGHSFLGERIDLIHAGGIALILAGIVLIHFKV